MFFARMFTRFSNLIRLKKYNSYDVIKRNIAPGETADELYNLAISYFFLYPEHSIESMKESQRKQSDFAKQKWLAFRLFEMNRIEESYDYITRIPFNNFNEHEKNEADRIIHAYNSVKTASVTYECLNSACVKNDHFCPPVMFSKVICESYYIKIEKLYCTVSLLLKLKKIFINENDRIGILFYFFLDNSYNVIKKCKNNQIDNYSECVSDFAYITNKNIKDGILDITEFIEMPENTSYIRIMFCISDFSDAEILDPLRIDNKLLLRRDIPVTKSFSDNHARFQEEPSTKCPIAVPVLFHDYLSVSNECEFVQLNENNYIKLLEEVSLRVVITDHVIKSRNEKKIIARAKTLGFRIVLWDFIRCIDIDVKGEFYNLRLFDTIFTGIYSRVGVYKSVNKKSYYLPLGMPTKDLTFYVSDTFVDVHGCNDLFGRLGPDIHPFCETRYDRINTAIFGKLINSAGDADAKSLHLLWNRKLLADHTMVDRLNYIFEKNELSPLFIFPYVVCYHEAGNPVEYNRALRRIRKFVYPLLRHIVVCRSGFEIPPSDVISGVSCISPEDLPGSLNSFNDENVFVAFCSDNFYYGSSYVSELVNGLKLGSFSAVTSSVFLSAEGGNHVIVNDTAYAYTDTVNPYKSIVKISVLRKFVFHGDVPGDLNPVNAVGIPVFALCGSPDKELMINVIESHELVDSGFSMHDIDSQNGFVQVIKSRVFHEIFILDARHICKLFKESFNPLNEKHQKITISYHNSLCSVKSRMADNDYEYFYSSKLYKAEKIGITPKHCMKCFSSGSLHIDIVIVYMNDSYEIIGNFIADIRNDDFLSGNVRFTPAANAKYAKIGFRIQGNGECLLTRLAVVNATNATPLFCSRTLVLSRYYPSCNDIYRNGFIHSRLKEYERAKFRTDFFEYSSDSEFLSCRQYDGIQVMSGNLSTLDFLLSHNYYNKVCVHFMYPDLWRVLSKFYNKVKIIVWCHGTEIDNWDVRTYDYCLMTDEQINKEKKIRENRQRFFRDLILNYPDIDFIFVSGIFRNRVLKSLQIASDIPCNTHVIHNYINLRLFQYHPRKPEDRYKLLSIRPFASRRYANDLTVEAIKLLRDKDYFSKLRIEIYGAGKLYQETVAELSGFNNVLLHNKFLPQSEIPYVHADNGIFVVPTRGDTQGVSRDEAMASGLVPVTTAVDAVPEFTDAGCACVVPPDSPSELARAIDYLVSDPVQFMAMSVAAHEKVRSLSSFCMTIARELDLIKYYSFTGFDYSQFDVIVYCDINPNIFDGSSMWLFSVCSILLKHYRPLVLLKNNLKDKSVVDDLLNNKSISFIQPKDFKLHDNLDKYEISRILIDLEYRCINVHSLIVRGYDIAYEIALNNAYRGKLYSYYSAFYKPGDKRGFEIFANLTNKIRTLLSYSCKNLFQTKFLAAEYIKFYDIGYTYSILPPAVPDNLAASLNDFSDIDKDSINIGYGGKWYPDWGVEELIQWSSGLIRSGVKLKLHLVISKYYNNKLYKQNVNKLLKKYSDFIIIYTNKNRTENLSIMKAMDFVWCWRPGNFEFSTLEYSMKLIENVSIAKRCLCQPSLVNRDLLTDEYPLFVENYDDFRKVITENTEISDQISEKLKLSMSRFQFSNITII